VTDAVITASLRQARLAERERRKVLRRLRLSDRGFHLVTQLSAAAVLVILGGVILSLVLGFAARDPEVRLQLSRESVVEPCHR